MWERSCADTNYGTLEKFFERVGEHLNRGGRIVIHFGTSGDVVYFKYLIRKNGFKRKQILRNSRVGWTYYTYRLTRQFDVYKMHHQQTT
jgi:hypothetical protein